MKFLILDMHNILMLDAVLLKLHKWTLLVMRSSLQGGHNFDPIQEIGPNVGGGEGSFMRL